MSKNVLYDSHQEIFEVNGVLYALDPIRYRRRFKHVWNLTKIFTGFLRKRTTIYRAKIEACLQVWFEVSALYYVTKFAVTCDMSCMESRT